MAEQEQAAVAGFVPGSLDGGEELIRYDGDKLFALVHRFVCCCRCWSGCDSRACGRRAREQWTKGASPSRGAPLGVRRSMLSLFADSETDFVFMRILMDGAKCK